MKQKCSRQFFLDVPDIIITPNTMGNPESCCPTIEIVADTEPSLPGDASFVAYRDYFFSHTLKGYPINFNSPQKYGGLSRKVFVTAAMLTIENEGGPDSLIEPETRLFSTTDRKSIEARLHFLLSQQLPVWISTDIPDACREEETEGHPDYSSPLFKNVTEESYQKEVLPLLDRYEAAYCDYPKFVKIFPQSKNVSVGAIQITRGELDNPDDSLGGHLIFEMSPQQYTGRGSLIENPYRVQFRPLPEPLFFVDNISESANRLLPSIINPENSKLYEKIRLLYQLLKCQDMNIEVMFQNQSENTIGRVAFVTDVDFLETPFSFIQSYLWRIVGSSEKSLNPNRFRDCKVIDFRHMVDIIELDFVANSIIEAAAGFVPNMGYKPKHARPPDGAAFRARTAYRREPWYQNAPRASDYLSQLS